MKLKGVFVGLCVLFLGGCFEKADAETQLEKDLCITNSYDLDVNKKQCKQGVRIAFLPKSFGNEQLPVIFAALHCNHTRSIALTNGAVSCIFSPAAKQE